MDFAPSKEENPSYKVWADEVNKNQPQHSESDPLKGRLAKKIVSSVQCSRRQRAYVT